MSRIVLIVLLLLSLVPRGAQVTAGTKYRMITQNTKVWLMYFGNNKLTPLLGGHSEVEVRRYHVVRTLALLSHISGSLKLSHRYQLDQRMIGNASTGAFCNGRYENRFRYRVNHLPAVCLVTFLFT